MLQTSIDLDFAARVLATASAELDGDGGNDDQAFCFVDGPTTDLSRRMTGDLPDSFNNVMTLALTGAVDLDPGTHAIAVRCGVNTGAGEVEFEEGNLTVWAVAR